MARLVSALDMISDWESDDDINDHVDEPTPKTNDDIAKKPEEKSGIIFQSEPKQNGNNIPEVREEQKSSNENRTREIRNDKVHQREHNGFHSEDKSDNRRDSNERTDSNNSYDRRPQKDNDKRNNAENIISNNERSDSENERFNRDGLRFENRRPNNNHNNEHSDDRHTFDNNHTHNDKREHGNNVGQRVQRFREGQTGKHDEQNSERRHGNDDHMRDVDERPKIPPYIPPEPSNDEAEIFGQGIHSGINFDNYDKIEVTKTGKDVPKELTSFETSGLSDLVLENIQKSGYSRLLPIQKHAIPVVLAKRDLMGCAQTGSGKTAAFLVPIINMLLEDSRPLEIGKPHVLIISPTRELTIQIFNEARKFSVSSYLKTCIMYGGTAVRHQQAQFNRGCHILVAAPGRLQHFIEMIPISFEHIRCVVLDEADRLLELGFIPDITRILNHPSMVKRQTLMFSATFPAEIQRLAGQFLDEYVFVAVGIVGGACADVEQVVLEVRRHQKRKKLLEILDDGDCSGTIVFVETKKQADFLAAFLSETEHPTTSIHGDRLQEQREKALADFKANRMNILIGTRVLARGLDIKSVKHVINYDMPQEIDEYVHRIGRTGRVGNKGKATSFFDPDSDGDIVNHLVAKLRESDQLVPDFLQSTAGGSAESRSNRSRFGARDVRNTRNFTDAQPQQQEQEEQW